MVSVYLNFTGYGPRVTQLKVCLTNPLPKDESLLKLKALRLDNIVSGTEPRLHLVTKGAPVLNIKLCVFFQCNQSNHAHVASPTKPVQLRL